MDKEKDIIEEVIELEPEEDKTSSVVISPDVVASIATVSTNEINGVYGMYTSFAGGIAEILGKKNSNKGVKVDIKDGTVIIDLYIVVDYGIKIPNIAVEVQENVKNNVETMTGLDVVKVNVHIDGVSFKKSGEEEAKREKEAKEQMSEIIVEAPDAEENANTESDETK